ncbi:hypothetical protein AHiyo8_40560 [Arthrobacter sp. Hiyo8]|nr:hypothetical protein AHiyo8_40560 [Arthrobacter sp. Hiyo8]
MGLQRRVRFGVAVSGAATMEMSSIASNRVTPLGFAAVPVRLPPVPMLTT